MIRDGDNVYAYQVRACAPSEDRYLIIHQWEAEQNKWTKIGTVVDAVGSGRKQLYEGKEYDYVFDVDIQDGAPPLKLPYNASGIVFFKCMYSADQKPAKKIPIRLLTNSLLAMSCHCHTSAAVQLGGPSNQYVDPYTGALPPSFVPLVILKKGFQGLQGISNQRSAHKLPLANMPIHIPVRIDISPRRTLDPPMSALVM